MALNLTKEELESIEEERRITKSFEDWFAKRSREIRLAEKLGDKHIQFCAFHAGAKWNRNQHEIA